MKVDVFLTSTYNNKERDTLIKMYDGIKRDLFPDDADGKYKKMIMKINKEKNRGTGVDLNYNSKGNGKYDLAVIMGSWKPERNNPHHNVRTKVAEDGRPFLCIETQLLGRKVFQPNMYHRVGLNGFLNKQGIFGPEQDYPSDRFDALKLPYKGWKQNRGDVIVVALQLPGDASMRGIDISAWCSHLLSKARDITDRPIEIRTHPGASSKGLAGYAELYEYLAFANHKNVTCVNGKDIPWEDHILNAHAVVTYSSGLAIDAVLNGVPTIAHDSGNFGYPICDNKIEKVEEMSLASEDTVQQWLNTLAYCQWTPAEMEAGVCWQHIKPCVLELLEEKEKEEDESS